MALRLLWRSSSEYDALHEIIQDVLLVADPRKYEFGIPTRQKPAHLNSAHYASDGQILVTHDLIGLFPWFTPKFVSPAARVAEEIRRAATAFIERTRSGNALSNPSRGRSE